MKAPWTLPPYLEGKITKRVYTQNMLGKTVSKEYLDSSVGSGSECLKLCLRNRFLKCQNIGK